MRALSPMKARKHQRFGQLFRHQIMSPAKPQAPA